MEDGDGYANQQTPIPVSNLNDLADDRIRDVPAIRGGSGHRTISVIELAIMGDQHQEGKV